MTEKYSFAVKFYKKAIKLGSINLTKALLGDALLFSGKYKEALLMYEEYLKEDFKDEEFVLKHLILSKILNLTGIFTQNRNIVDGRGFAGSIDSQSEEIINANLKRAINHDMLCGLAWFNIGHLEMTKGDCVRSLYSYAFCAILDTRDIEAWIYAVIALFKSTNPDVSYIGALIIRVAYLYHSDVFLCNLYTILEEKGFEVSIIQNSINSIIEGVGRDNPTFIRFYKDGVVNEVRLNE